MEKVAIVTDSNSGITQKQAGELGVSVLPMPFYIDGILYFEDITLDQPSFYQKLAEDAEIHTSQPTPDDLMKLWDTLLEQYESIVHIPMSRGLSGSCATAQTLAAEYDGRVEVVDNHRISVTLRQSVLDAKRLAMAGKTAAEIKELLERTKAESHIFITLETLKYLKRGGRITPAAAAIGTVLNLKPVLQIDGGKLDAYAKVRGKKQARETMIDAIRMILQTKFAGLNPAKDLMLQAAYTGNEAEASDWKQELLAAFPGMEFYMDPLSLSVACHIGQGALAVACTKKLEF